MGIRFYCPNGHKLNVKGFLAGKRGICPHCDSRFQIPHESEIPDNAPSIRTATPQPSFEQTTKDVGETPGPPTAVNAGLGPGGDRSLDQTLIQTEAVPGSLSINHDDQEPVGQNTLAVAPDLDIPSAPATDVAPSSSPSNGRTAMPAAAPMGPIEEAPESVWYVRPPSGGQYGPARGDVMRRWIEEGRVSADSLVWREGWDDWKTAGPVFPSLQDDPAGSMLSESSDFSASPSYSGPSRGQPRSVGKKSIAIVVVLGLLIVVLFVVLIQVL